MLDRDSVLWRYAGDARVLPFLGAPFLLQAAHPTIGAGVADHSYFKQDPFGRFQHSYGLVLRAIYAENGDRVAAEIRASHKRIKGVKPDGQSYHAYEPEAYYWVLATGFDSLITTARLFGRPLQVAEERRAYDENRELGRRLGLRDRDMPVTLAEFREWFDWMLQHRIERNQTVEDVLATYHRPAPPRGVPALVWPLPRELVGRLAWVASIGPLPPALRARLGIPWTRRDALEFWAVVRATRATDVVPAPWFRLPIARDAYRRELGHPDGAAERTPARAAA